MVNISPKLYKKGAASIYVVVFATILFSVITLSFIRIILSETSQSSNDDLSQSAYDSALAGVEDAKTAINQYYHCLSSSGDANTCNGETLFKQNCSEYGLVRYLYGEDNQGEVKIQESSNPNNNTTSEQAYTCVILNNVVDDYRSTLTSDTRTRVIPLSINRGDDTGGTTQVSRIETIRFSWYSELNGTEFKNLLERSNVNASKFPSKNEASTPPVIALTLIRVGETFRYEDFSNAQSVGENVYSTIVLKPIQDDRNDETANEIRYSTIVAADNAYKGVSNEPILVECKKSEFACNVALTEMSFQNNDNVLLVASLPYGDMLTDFVITLEDANGETIQFENAQISVDSTGRANQLVRRVETRLEPANIFFPYPQYALELTGESDSSTTKKDFWITNNCWTESGPCDNNGDF